METPRLRRFIQAITAEDYQLALQLVEEILCPSKGYPESIKNYVIRTIPAELRQDIESPIIKLSPRQSSEYYCEAFKNHPDAHLLGSEYNLPLVACQTATDHYTPYHVNQEIQSVIKLIAFYLPQFHPFPENDTWWGKGFTEWTNVGKAVPQFPGHYQPHCPIHCGYYDLRVVENMINQYKLASNYGIHGFAYYFYWFNGKILMELPLQNMLKEKDIDFPFCLTWANENWTRRWDGKEHEILIRQSHSLDDSESFLRHLRTYFDDSRYIKHNGMPILIVYRADIIPEMRDVIRRWRKLMQEWGYPGIYLIAALTFGFTEVEAYGFDAGVEFPPHSVVSRGVRHEIQGVNCTFEGEIYDYTEVVNNKIIERDPAFKKHYCTMLGWDNTARKGINSSVFARFSLAKYQQWLVYNCTKTLAMASKHKDYPLLTFINAWNEWAEGTHLEPDQRYGYGYLSASYNVIKRFAGSESDYCNALNQMDPRRGGHCNPKKKCLIIHSFFVDVFSELIDLLNDCLALAEFDVYVTTDTIVKASKIRSHYNGAIIDLVPNIGRDILPFIVTLNSIKDAGIDYDVGLKIHTKKSQYRLDGSKLRHKLIGDLLSEQAISMSGLINAGSKTGLVVPEHALISHYDQSGNRLRYHHNRIEEFSQRLNFDFTPSSFVAGSMYWFSPTALRRLTRLTVADFSPEIGLSDGTAAHTIERLIVPLIRDEGFQVVSV